MNHPTDGGEGIFIAAYQTVSGKYVTSGTL